MSRVAARWTAAQDEALRRAAADSQAAVRHLAERIGCTYRAAYLRSRRLGVQIPVSPDAYRLPPPRNPWTAAQDAAVRRAAAADDPRAALRDLAPRIGRTVSAVKHRAYDLGVLRIERAGAWTPDEDAALRRAVELNRRHGLVGRRGYVRRLHRLAARLGRSYRSVERRARRLGLRSVPPEWRQRRRPDPPPPGNPASAPGSAKPARSGDPGAGAVKTTHEDCA